MLIHCTQILCAAAGRLPLKLLDVRRGLVSTFRVKQHVHVGVFYKVCYQGVRTFNCSIGSIMVGEEEHPHASQAGHLLPLHAASQAL